MEGITVKDIARMTGARLVFGRPDKEVKRIVTDSRGSDSDTLFVAIKGERVDGHNFMTQSLIKDSCVLSSRIPYHQETEDSVDGAVLVVPDTVEALMKLAAAYRERFNLPVVGVTGSVGKTSTKEMVSCALETRYNILKTEGNLNSRIGVSVMVSRLAKAFDIAVFEMGISEPGEMEQLSYLAKPRVAVVTNIGVSHLNQFKTRENIAAGKLDIISETIDPKQAVLILNADDDMLKRVIEYKRSSDEKALGGIALSDRAKEVIKKAELITYGLADDCDFKAENISVYKGITRFTLVCSRGKCDCGLSVLGMHNIYNALSAMAVGTVFGIEPDISLRALKSYRPLNMRGTIVEHNGYKVIDDTYNASPDSMKSGLTVLGELEDTSLRIACLADILELGEKSEEIHYELGEYIAQYNEAVDTGKKPGFEKIDVIVTVGPAAHFIVKGLRDYEKAKELDPVIAKSFDTNKDAADYILSRNLNGTSILCKGSRGMHVEEVVGFLTGEKR